MDWWRRRRWTRPRIDRILCVATMDEVPDPIPRHVLAVVRTPDQLKWAVFECPCGFGHQIMVNLDRRHKSAWSLTHTKPPSLHPSVDFLGQRRCHFWLRGGRVSWVPDLTGRPPTPQR